LHPLLHIRPIQWYLREFWHPFTHSNVGGLYSCSSQTTASSSVVVTEVQPFNRCTSWTPRFHTDSLYRRLPNRMGCLTRRENRVRGVGRLSFNIPFQEMVIASTAQVFWFGIVIQTGGKQIYQGAIPYQSDCLKNYWM
jgi:hypothetical protein